MVLTYIGTTFELANYEYWKISLDLLLVAWDANCLAMTVCAGGGALRGGHGQRRGGDEAAAARQQGAHPGAHCRQQDQLQVTRAADGQRDRLLQQQGRQQEDSQEWEVRLSVHVMYW